MESGVSRIDLHGYFIEDLTVGMSASYAKTITEADIVIFAGIACLFVCLFCSVSFCLVSYRH